MSAPAVLPNFRTLRFRADVFARAVALHICVERDGYVHS
jgi:hypothetical protein